MSNTITLTITDNNIPIATLNHIFNNDNPQLGLQRMSQYFQNLQSGAVSGKAVALMNTGNAVRASGTLTVSSGVATDTAVVAGTTLTCIDKRETTNVTFTADTAGSLNSKFFTFEDQPGTNKYYVWFNINSAGVDPAPTGRTGFAVAGATGASAATLATAAVAACASAVGVTVAAGAAGHVIFTTKAPGVATKVTDGSAATSFTFTRSITGSALTAAQYQVFTSDTLTAADLVRAINANTSMNPFVSAANVAGVVTVTAVAYGISGNTIATTASGGVSAGGALLTGGTADTSAITYQVA
jgi:hypothetical protein